MRIDRFMVEPFRVLAGPYASAPGDTFGAFMVRMDNLELTIIVDDGVLSGWEHVSVSVVEYYRKKSKGRIPTWEEMCLVKYLFWEDTEAVMQLHPPTEKYVNQHPHVLHLWKPVKGEIPLPPSVLVGFKQENQNHEPELLTRFNLSARALKPHLHH